MMCAWSSRSFLLQVDSKFRLILDVLAVDALAGRFYRLEFDNASIDSAVVSITGGEGVQLAVGSTSAPAIWKAESTDRHFIAVSSNSDNVGDYSFTVMSIEDDHASHLSEATRIVGGTTVEGEVSWPGNVDWFRFATQPGIAYELHVVPTNELADVLVEVADDRATVLHTDVDGGASRLRLPITREEGELFVSVQSISRGLGAYTLSLAEYEPELFRADERPGDATLELGVPSSGRPETIRRTISEIGGGDRVNFRSVPGAHYYRSPCVPAHARWVRRALVRPGR